MNGLDCMELLTPEDDEALCHRIGEATMNMGFEKVMFVVLPFQSASLDVAYVWTNCAPEWTYRYRQQSFDLLDPMLRHCFRSTVPFIWDASCFVTPAQRQLYDIARGHGMSSGVTLPVRGIKGELGMFTCATSDDIDITRDRCANSLACLSLLRDIVTDTLARRAFDTRLNGVPRLSRREAECLKWHAAGKTSWEIGHILNVTESCINFHFTNIRRKFNVSRRHEAVLKAIEWGLINVTDGGAHMHS